jgi:hypothetical protein
VASVAWAVSELVVRRSVEPVQHSERSARRITIRRHKQFVQCQIAAGAHQRPVNPQCLQLIAAIGNWHKRQHYSPALRAFFSTEIHLPQSHDRSTALKTVKPRLFTAARRLVALGVFAIAFFIAPASVIFAGAALGPENHTASTHGGSHHGHHGHGSGAGGASAGSSSYGGPTPRGNHEHLWLERELYRAGRIHGAPSGRHGPPKPVVRRLNLGRVGSWSSE